MYAFILSMWVAGHLTEQQVYSYCPLFINEMERDTILATPKRV